MAKRPLFNVLAAICAIALCSQAICQAQPAPSLRYRTVQLKPMKSWCSTVRMTEIEASKDDLVDAAREAAIKTLDESLLADSVSSSGIPGVVDIEKSVPNVVAAAPDQPPAAGTMTFNVCATVPSDTGKPTNPLITERLLPSARYAVLTCSLESDKACLDALRDALIDDMGADQHDAIFSSLVLLTSQLSANAPDSQVADAFSSAADRRITSNGLIQVTGAMDLSKEDLSAEAPRKVITSQQATAGVSGLPEWRNISVAVKLPNLP